MTLNFPFIDHQEISLASVQLINPVGEVPAWPLQSTQEIL